MKCPRTCEFCSKARAVLYCVADSAKLCLSCDREVHSTNNLFLKHNRSILCDSCDNAPATIFCGSESLSLCRNCDFDKHTNCWSHERRALEGFVGCLKVDEIVEWLGFEKLDLKEEHSKDENNQIHARLFDDDCLEMLVWETPTIVSIDDLIASNAPEMSYRAMGVPPLPKNRKAACGKYKEEILDQLREMAKSETNLSNGHEDIKPIIEFPFPGTQQDLYPADMYSKFGNSADSPKSPSFKGDSFWCTDNVDFANENLSSKLLGSSFDDSCLVPDKDSDINGNLTGDSFWCTDNVDFANENLSSKLLGSSFDDSCLVPDKDSDINGNVRFINYGHDEQAIHPVSTESPQILPKFMPRELTSQERDSAILRYKEKKRTRRYDKHVRYESRKIRAENRTRVKGRFAKIDHQSTGML